MTRGRLPREKLPNNGTSRRQGPGSQQWLELSLCKTQKEDLPESPGALGWHSWKDIWVWARVWKKACEVSKLRGRGQPEGNSSSMQQREPERSYSPHK